MGTGGLLATSRSLLLSGKFGKWVLGSALDGVRGLLVGS